jgi:WD40 repeat protein
MEHPAALSLGQPVWIGRGKIVSAVFLPGARQVAIAWGNGVSLNTVDTGQELWFQATPARVLAFDVQAQGQAFAAALADESVMTFDVATGNHRRFQAAQHDALQGDIAWSPDRRTLAFQFIIGPHSEPIHLLDVASGQFRDVPDSQKQTGDGVIPVLVWSPDGSSILIAAAGDQFPRFVDVQTGRERMRMHQPGQLVSSAPLFLADGQTLASEGRAGEVELLRFPDGVKEKALRSGSRLLGRWLSEFPDAGSPLFTDPAGRWIADRGGYEPCYCEGDITPQYPLVVWDLARGTVRARLSQALDALKERHRLAATFDGDSILMFYASGEITRWPFSDPRARETVVAHVPVRPVSYQTLSWSADGSRVAFSGLYGGVEVYDSAGRLVQRFDPPLTALALSPDGQLAALFDPDQNMEVLYQVQEKHLVRTLSASPVLKGGAFSPDGRYLAYGARNQAAVVELASGRVSPLNPAAIVPAGAAAAFTRLIWSPDGQSLVTAIDARTSITASQGIVVLWKRLEDGSFTAIDHVANAQAGYDTPRLTLAAYNPAGRRVALPALPDNDAGQAALHVYDLNAGKLVQTFAGYRLGTWISDEDLLAVEAQYGNRLTLINATNGQKTIAGVSDNGAATYSRGGTFIAQVDTYPYRTVTIREWRSGGVVTQVPFGSLDLLDYHWSPDGRWFATIGGDGTLRIRPVSIN